MVSSSTTSTPSTTAAIPGAVLITGTTSGVGLNAVKALVDRGWTVVTANRDPIRAAVGLWSLAMRLTVPSGFDPGGDGIVVLVEQPGVHDLARDRRCAR